MTIILIALILWTVRVFSNDLITVTPAKDSPKERCIVLVNSFVSFNFSFEDRSRIKNGFLGRTSSRNIFVVMTFSKIFL
ncbi:hypothetical protein BGW37DRAFT_492344 [Umbelopsis sp. PMI_123]|nr:hypothetical protein BGW37DRAFT_492344 [Umbelopsis sp. PMI_123]